VDVEEHNEEHERHAERDLRGDAEAEPYGEDRSEDDPWHGVECLDIRVEERRCERAQAEPQPGRETENRSDKEGKHRLEQGHPQVAVDLAAREPVPDAPEHLERLSEEERRSMRVIEV